MMPAPLSSRIRAALSPHLSADPARLGVTHATSELHAYASRFTPGSERPWQGAHLKLCDERMSAPGQGTQSDLFDLASLTKPLVTATLAMQAVDEGLMAWDTPVGELLPGWRAPQAGERDATLLELLNHSSGLPAWHKYYLEYPLDLQGDAARAQREVVLARVLDTPRSPPGTSHVYSDLGYMALCALLERALGADLDLAAQVRIFTPVGMPLTRYVSALRSQEPLREAVRTELCAQRGQVQGVAHDENTCVLGGVAGHAGVFSTAHDLARFAQHLLDIDSGRVRDGALVKRDTLRFCWSEAARGAGAHLGGWDTPSGARSSAGRWLRAGRTVGHLGFTGTSLWIERRSHTVAILLTNRVYPTRENPRILDLRIAFHEAIWDNATAEPPRTQRRRTL